MNSSLDVTAAYTEALSNGDVAGMQALWSDQFVLDWVYGDMYENGLASWDEFLLAHSLFLDWC